MLAHFCGILVNLPDRPGRSADQHPCVHGVSCLAQHSAISPWDPNRRHPAMIALIDRTTEVTALGALAKRRKPALALCTLRRG